MKYRMVLGLILAMVFVVACGTDPTPTSPIITHELDVVVDPAEAGDFLLNPKPLDRGDYVDGRTVVIDALPKAGGEVAEWIGPVHDELGDTATLVAAADSNGEVYAPSAAGIDRALIQPRRQ